MKNLLILVALGLFVAIIGSGSTGCGGGSSGSGSGGSNTATTGTTLTAGNTGINPSSTIFGQIVRSGSTIGIPGITVQFLDVNGTVLATAVTRSDGVFDAQVGTDAVKFQLDKNSISSAFLKLYRYNTKWYSATISTCSAPLPAITPGVLKELPFDPIAVPLATSTPPFPNGCLP